MAASFNVGLANAFDNTFDDVETVFTGTFEYYSSPRVSWRGLVGTTTFEENSPGNPDIDVRFVNANIGYNWEHGDVHPYLTGGIGLYDKKGSPGLAASLDESTFGLNAGGGLEWFLGSRWGLKFEGTLHGLNGENPDTFLLGTAGFMFWF